MVKEIFGTYPRLIPRRIDDMSEKTNMLPATINVIQRAESGLNALFGMLDHNRGLEPYCYTYLEARPAYMSHWSGAISNVLPYALETVTMLRTMTNDTRYAAEARALEEAVISFLGSDGLIYDRVADSRPWNKNLESGSSWNGDYASIAGNGRLVRAMSACFSCSGDKKWLGLIEKTANMLASLAVIDGDTAYYPNLGHGCDYGYFKEADFKSAAKPSRSQDGKRGFTLFYQAEVLGGLVKWYEISGDCKIIELCEKLVNFIMKPVFWGAVTEIDPVFGATRAHFWGNLSGALATLRNLMEYAMVSENYIIMEFVRDGYEWARHNLSMELGLDINIESSSIANLIGLSLMLTEAGQGDFIDDADSVFRNALVEAQITDIEALEYLGKMGPERPIGAEWGANLDKRMENGIFRQPFDGMETGDNVINRNIGAFCANLLEGRYQSSCITYHDTACGNMGFYDIWKGAVLHSNGVTTVNLFINHFTPWLNIESFLPYEGRVIIKSKQPQMISIRIPKNIGISSLLMTINGVAQKNELAGRYVFLPAKEGDIIELTYSQKREMIKILLPALNAKQYRGVLKLDAEFIGSTCIGLVQLPPHHSGILHYWKRIFDRPEYSRKSAPLSDSPYYNG
jgi:hypothetical protein